MTDKPETQNFPIVCVGGSAGGLDAYTRLLRHLPAETGAAVVAVNHIRSRAKRVEAEPKGAEPKGSKPSQKGRGVVC